MPGFFPSFAPALLRNLCELLLSGRTIAPDGGPGMPGTALGAIQVLCNTDPLLLHFAPPQGGQLPFDAGAADEKRGMSPALCGGRSDVDARAGALTCLLVRRIAENR